MWGWRQERIVFLGVAWFFVTLLPVANLLPIPGVRDAALAERYLYIPSIGICLALGGAGARVAAWVGRKGFLSVRWAIGGLLLNAVGLYAPVTLRWMPVWKDNEALYRQMLRRSPGAAFPYTNLAAELFAHGQVAAAQSLIARAISLDPTRPEAHRVDGAMRRVLGDMDGALAAMRRSQALMPESVPTLIELGTTLADGGDLAGSLNAFRQALAIDPQAAEAYNRMGVAYVGAGQLDRAAQAFQRARDLSPDFVFAHYNLAVTLHKMNRNREALASLLKGMRLAPTDPRLQALYVEIQSKMPPAQGNTRSIP